VYKRQGLALAVHGLRVGTRRTLLTIDQASLVVERSDALGRSDWRLARQQIASIQVEDSGTRINDRILWRLAVAGRDGTRITCGYECSKPELAVVAARLRAATYST
jgi:hypothetical protein